MRSEEVGAGDAAAQRIPLTGICTGTFILADAGLMGEHEACVSWLNVKA